MVLILGGRSGKSSIVGGIATYEAIGTDWTKFVRKGELAWIFVIARREQQAIDIGRNIIFANLDKSPYLRDMIIEDPSQLSIRSFPSSRTGVRVLKTGAAITALPCSSRVGRGYPIACAILDEVAHFARESQVQTTDQGIYDSILPRTIQFGEFGRIFMITTPADKSGLVWHRWQSRKRNPEIFCVRIPTWKIRTDWPKSYYAQLRNRSPLGYAQEFGAEFMNSMRPLVIKDDVLAVCRVGEDFIVLEYNKDLSYVMAVDQAFGELDRFAISIGHLMETADGENFKVIIDLVETVESEEGKDLVEVAADRVATLYTKYDIFEVYMDQYQADAFGKILEDKGCNIEVTDWTSTQHRIKYGRLKNFIRRKMIELPPSEELADELSTLQIKFLPSSGQYTVVHKPGCHDDMADACAEVVYRLTDDLMTEGGMDFGEEENQLLKKAEDQ